MFKLALAATAVAALFIPLAAQSAPTRVIPDGATSVQVADGLVMNGFSLNGLNFNGLTFNGWSLNSRNFNGLNFNGLNFNGLNFNGVTLNSKLFNGIPFDGRLSQRGFVGVFESADEKVVDPTWTSLALADVRVRLPLAR